MSWVTMIKTGRRPLVVRHILNLAAGEWMDEHGLTWLAAAPKIKLLPEHDGRKPYPLTWKEQDRLVAALPHHLQEMAYAAQIK